MQKNFWINQSERERGERRDFFVIELWMIETNCIKSSLYYCMVWYCFSIMGSEKGQDSMQSQMVVAYLKQKPFRYRYEKKSSISFWYFEIK